MQGDEPPYQAQVIDSLMCSPPNYVVVMTQHSMSGRRMNGCVHPAMQGDEPRQRKRARYGMKICSPSHFVGGDEPQSAIVRYLRYDTFTLRMQGDGPYLKDTR
jgi:hypothetical protein